MAFKMKGSPMQRNFGIGGPLKKEEEEQLIATPTQQVIQGFKQWAGVDIYDIFLCYS